MMIEGAHSHMQTGMGGHKSEPYLCGSHGVLLSPQQPSAEANTKRQEKTQKKKSSSFCPFFNRSLESTASGFKVERVCVRVYVFVYGCVAMNQEPAW